MVLCVDVRPPLAGCLISHLNTGGGLVNELFVEHVAPTCH